jgi:hypothetical protein
MQIPDKFRLTRMTMNTTQAKKKKKKDNKLSTQFDFMLEINKAMTYQQYCS